MKHNIWGRTISILILLTLAFSSLGITPAHAAATITVNSTADNAIAADGQCTLREALTNANGDRDTSGGDCVAGAGVDTIQFAAALGTATITLTSALPDITDNDALTMDGGNRITVSGNDSVRVFRVLQGGLTLQNISVVHGRATVGAGLYTANDSANAVINCMFANNVATLYGGGIQHDSTSTLTILNSTFSSNHADSEGGGLSLKNGRTASIANSTFTNNSAPYGGGVENTEHSTVTISNSTFSDNHADSDGGGVGNNTGGTVSITNSTFTNNSAPYGGGVENNSATMTIVSSTFSGNTAPAGGGGLLTYQTDEPPVTTVYNSIFANSVSPNDCLVFVGVGTLTGGNNIIETTPTGSVGCDSIKISSEDPLLGGLGSYGGFTQTIPLLPGSSAIDAGNPTYCTAGHDQREVAYVGACDIGAFESQGFSLAVTGGNNQSVFTNAPFPLSLAVSVTAHAAIEPVNGGRVTFTPPASGASADLTGSPAVISGGSASVTAQANGTHGIYTVTAGASGAGSVDFSLTNRSSSGMITPTITWNNPANIPYGTALGNTQLNATADTAGTFTYTPASGTILAAGTHTLHVEFTPTDTANYTTASKDVSITVTKAAPVLTWNNPANIVYGTALGNTQLNATSNTPGAFTYTPAAGIVLPAGTHTLHVDFVPTDEANYATTSKDVSITVTKAAPFLTWNNPANIVYGTALGIAQLNATADTAGTFTYTPAAGIVLPAGTHTLHVDFVPTDTANYTNASKDVSITVTKAAPVITWGNPANIDYGTALGIAQLNASADVPGAFTYTPALGAYLPAGTHSLHVDFVPTDTANYANASKDVSITVNEHAIFTDVPSGYWAKTFIERLYIAGVTGGCGTSPLVYCPDAPVTRAQMAVFLLKAKHGSAYTPPPASGTVFLDVPQDSFAAAYIEALAAEGITGGCGGGNFCPNTVVTRAQMAVFLLRGKHDSAYAPPAATGIFGDVPTGYWAAAWIEALAAEGITGGCGGGNYCPSAIVNRGQMAVFLVAAFGLP